MNAMYKFHALTALLVGLYTFSPLSGFAQPPSIIEKINTLKASTVRIKALNAGLFQGQRPRAALDKRTGRIIVLRNVQGGSYNRFGAGVFVHPSGIIVTNAHTIHLADRITVTLNDNTELPARALFLVNNMDIGFLQVDPPYPVTPVPLANSDEIQLRDEIINIGNSEFLQQTVSGGQITGIGNSRTLKVSPEKNYLIQTSINLYQGDSGGPLFDRHGKLIGLVTAKETTADHSSFAIPSNIINRFLQEYLQGHYQ